MEYMDTTPHYKLVGKVNDKPADLKMLLFADADFAGDSKDTKSTSGGYLVLAGPKTWFPLAWICRKQVSSSRSTTEAEIVALAMSLFEEAIPTLDLWELILGREMELLILEDNRQRSR